MKVLKSVNGIFYDLLKWIFLWIDSMPCLFMCRQFAYELDEVFLSLSLVFLSNQTQFYGRVFLNGEQLFDLYK